MAEVFLVLNIYPPVRKRGTATLASAPMKTNNKPLRVYNVAIVVYNVEVVGYNVATCIAIVVYNVAVVVFRCRSIKHGIESSK